MTTPHEHEICDDCVLTKEKTMESIESTCIYCGKTFTGVVTCKCEAVSVKPLKPAEPRIHRKGTCVVCDRNELDQNPFALSHTVGKGASTAEPAPSAGWEEELKMVMFDYLRARELNKVVDFIRKSVREAEERAYLNSFRDRFKSGLLKGFDEAVKIVTRYTEIDDYIPNGEIKNSLTKKRTELLDKKE